MWLKKLFSIDTVNIFIGEVNKKFLCSNIYALFRTEIVLLCIYFKIFIEV